MPYGLIEKTLRASSFSNPAKHPIKTLLTGFKQKNQRTCVIPILPTSLSPLLTQPPDHHSHNRHTYRVQSKTLYPLHESQLPTLPPTRARIKPPRAAIPSPKPIVNHVRHKKRYGREIMPTALEVPVRGPEHGGGRSDTTTFVSGR